MSGEAAILIMLVLAVQWLFGRGLKPRWRYALWLLVLLRLALPWTIPSPASLFNFLKTPAVAQPVETGFVQPVEVPVSNAGVAAPSLPSSGVHWLAWLWAAGALFLMIFAVVSQYRFHRRLGRQRPLIDEPTLRLLEDCKALMGVSTPVTLVETEAVKSPALFGFVRPRLLLPTGLVSTFTREELRHVFLHELAHIKRFDILTGWVALGLQIIHWFNPLVWLAFHRLRADRELACDALALSYAGTGENESYGLTIVKLLEGFGQSVWGPGLAGILEDKHQIKERIRMIAKFHKTDRGLALAVVLLAGLALGTLTDAQNQTRPQPGKMSEPDASKGVWAVRFEPVDDFSPKTPGEFLGRIHQYSTSRSGQDGEIGYFRTTKQGDKLVASFLAYDADQLKAALDKVTDIKVTSVEKLTPETLAAYEKSPQETLAQAPAPHVVATTPAVGATDVNPALTEITVAFDQDMGSGMSWTGGGPDFPVGREGEKAYWRDKRTCVLPVKLEAGHYYRVGINSKSYRSFASDQDVAALPSAIYFTTQGASQDLEARTLVPQVIRFDPPNGAKDVSTAVSELRVTFNVPMGGGCSWCTVGDTDTDFPKGPAGKNMHWTEDKKTCVLPVDLKPGMTYRLSLNAPEYKNFQSDAGVALEPVIYTFTTSVTP